MDVSSLRDSISDTPHDFLRPSKELHFTSRLATKSFLDPLASSLQATHHKFQKNGRRDKKSTAYITKNRFRVQKLHLDGFSVEQIWEQAVRIIDGASEQLSNDIQTTAEFFQKGAANRKKPQLPESSASDQDVDTLEVEEISQSELESEPAINSDHVSGDMEGTEGDGDLDEDSEEESENLLGSDAEDDSSVSEDAPSETYVEDKFGLNDGFFSIDDFNKQTEYFEHLDQRRSY